MQHWRDRAERGAPEGHRRELRGVALVRFPTDLRPGRPARAPHHAPYRRPSTGCAPPRAMSRDWQCPGRVLAPGDAAGRSSNPGSSGGYTMASTRTGTRRRSAPAQAFSFGPRCSRRTYGPRCTRQAVIRLRRGVDGISITSASTLHGAQNPTRHSDGSPLTGRPALLRLRDKRPLAVRPREDKGGTRTHLYQARRPPRPFDHRPSHVPDRPVEAMHGQPTNGHREGNRPSGSYVVHSCDRKYAGDYS